MAPWKEDRIKLRISSSELARISNVDRLKIHYAEKGDRALKPEEQQRIQDALRREVERISMITVDYGTEVTA